MTGRPRPATVAALLAIVAAGALQLPTPFNGDQALFAVMARALHEGAALYRDAWDVKQPGVFLFFQAAGTLFGFDPIGVHLFELSYWLAFALVVVATSRSLFERSASPAVAAGLAVGAYYAACGPWQLTQLEALSGFPLYGCAWLAARRTPPTRADLLASGLCGGAALCFKLILGPLVAVFPVVAVLAAWRAGAFSLAGGIARSIGPFLAGLVLPPALCLAQSATAGALDLALFTWFVQPVHMLRGALPSDPARLLAGLEWWITAFLPVGLLAAVGILLPARRGELLHRQLLAWLVAGTAVILLQRTAWWSYHWLLLFAPLGLLAARGLGGVLGALAHARPARRALAGAALLLLALASLPSGQALVERVAALARHRFAWSAEDRIAYQRSASEAERVARDETAFLRQPDAAPGSIYVFGNPLLLYHSGRSQAVRWTASAEGALLPAQWQALRDDLAAARPSHVYLEDGYVPRLERRSPETLAFLTRYFEPVRRGERGTWYAPTSSATSEAGGGAP